MYINNIDDIVDVLNRIESKIKTLEDKVEELEYKSKEEDVISNWDNKKIEIRLKALEYESKEAKNYHNNLAIDVNNYKWDNDNRVKVIEDKLKLLKGDKYVK